MVFLSLFDGISCMQVALKNLGVRIDGYFACEIDKTAIGVTQLQHPNTIQLGDIIDLDTARIPTNIDCIIGGSPCQGFSFAGKQLNFNDPRSKLFFEFVRVLKEVKPKYFILENVSMKREYLDIISEHLGVDPIEINSAKTSAQNRVRMFWTNLPTKQPPDKNIDISDIVENSEMLHPCAIRGRRLNRFGKREDWNKSLPLIQYLEITHNQTKSNCMTTVEKDTVLSALPSGRYVANESDYRNYTKTERCRLMNLPDDYCDSVSMNKSIKLLGNGCDVGVCEHLLRPLLDV